MRRDDGVPGPDGVGCSPEAALHQLGQYLCDGGPTYNPDHHHAKVYLIDEVVDRGDVKKVVRRYWREIFEEDLNGWMRDPDVCGLSVRHWGSS